MKTNYEIIEYRGADIKYTAFAGTWEECNKWLNDNCHLEVEGLGDAYWASNDPSCVNGDGFAFRYTINEN